MATQQAELLRQITQGQIFGFQTSYAENVKYLANRLFNCWHLKQAGRLHADVKVTELVSDVECIERLIHKAGRQVVHFTRHGLKRACTNKTDRMFSEETERSKR